MVGHAELPIGLFLGDVFNFLIVALTLFVFIGDVFMRFTRLSNPTDN
jgi:large-conductance mechanosensitive channel